MLTDKPGRATTKTPRRPRYFYGWNIVAASFMAHLAYAEHFSATLGLFFRPLNKEFGWSRFQISAVQTIARGVEAAAAPIIGPLIDRFGARVLIPTGGLVVGLTMLAITQVTSLWQFYLLRGGVAAVGFTLMGFMVTAVAVNNWFVRKRGRAIAIASVGSSLSNVLLMPLTVFVLAVAGWRTMFVVFAVLAWLVVVIPSAILMRRRPEDMGLHPDGIAPDVADTATPTGVPAGARRETTSAPEPVWTRREAVGTSVFWLIAFCFGVDSLAFQGINISMAPYIQDLGYSDAIVAAALTFRAAVMAATLPLVGLVAEHAHRAPIRALPFLLHGLGAFLLLLAARAAFLWLAVPIYGLGVSSASVMQEVVWANYFGRLSLGRIRSTGFLVAFGFGAAGPILMNAIFDLVGSYTPAFVLFVVLFALAALVISLAKPPTARRYAIAEEMAAPPGSPLQ